MADGSLSQFKATLARKIERNQKRQARSERNSTSYQSSDRRSEFNSPKLTESELEKVKIDIRKKARLERKKEIIKIFIGLFIILAIMYFIFFYLIWI